MPPAPLAGPASARQPESVTTGLITVRSLWPGSLEQGYGRRTPRSRSVGTKLARTAHLVPAPHTAQHRAALLALLASRLSPHDHPEGTT